MSLFKNSQEMQRLANLKRLEDKRLAFARKMREDGVRFGSALLVQSGGGFMGIGLSGSDVYLLGGPAPIDEQGEFKAEKITGADMRFEPHTIPGEGAGGVLGFGKKGGRGYMLVIDRPDAERLEIEFVPALQCMYESVNGDLPLLSETRRRKDANFVWEFRPLETREMNDIVLRWSGLL